MPRTIYDTLLEPILGGGGCIICKFPYNLSWLGDYTQKIIKHSEHKFFKLLRKIGLFQWTPALTKLWERGQPP